MECCGKWRKLGEDKTAEHCVTIGARCSDPEDDWGDKQWDIDGLDSYYKLGDNEYFLVRWANSGGDCTWEPLENLTGVTERTIRAARRVGHVERLGVPENVDGMCVLCGGEKTSDDIQCCWKCFLEDDEETKSAWGLRDGFTDLEAEFTAQMLLYDETNDMTSILCDDIVGLNAEVPQKDVETRY